MHYLHVIHLNYRKHLYQTVVKYKGKYNLKKSLNEFYSVHASIAISLFRNTIHAFIIFVTSDVFAKLSIVLQHVLLLLLSFILNLTIAIRFY
jgi:hypothetical protein